SEPTSRLTQPQHATNLTPGRRELPRIPNLLKSPLTTPLPPFFFTPQIGTFEVVSGACTTNPKDTFQLGEVVCVRAVNPPFINGGFPISSISVIGTNSTVMAIEDVNSDPKELVFTLPA